MILYLKRKQKNANEKNTYKGCSKIYFLEWMGVRKVQNKQVVII